MDDLDRLYAEFVSILRRERPAALKDAISIAELHGRVIPYRRVRNAVGFRSNDEYEIALSRLLSGEREYLASDRLVQDELRAGLGERLPDIRRYLAFPDARVRLNPDKIPLPGDFRYAPPEVREQVDWSSTSISDSQSVPDPSPEEPATRPETQEIEEQTFEAPVLSECPRCQADLPETAAFCPYCGSRLASEACRSCGAELQATYSFCASCGEPRERPPRDSS